MGRVERGVVLLVEGYWVQGAWEVGWEGEGGRAGRQLLGGWYQLWWWWWC